MLSLNVPGLCFHIWPGDSSFEPKHATEFLILITIYIVVLLTGINYYITEQRGSQILCGGNLQPRTDLGIFPAFRLRTRRVNKRKCLTRTASNCV